MESYNGFILRYKQQVTEISSLDFGGVPRLIQDAFKTPDTESGFFAYNFQDEKLFETLELLKEAIENHGS